MCLIALAYRTSAAFPLVIAGNRDEFLDRHTAPLAWWHSPAGTAILGGRDLQEGGSWMGFTPQGRFAMLTNVRQGTVAPIAQPISRGSLVRSWLDSTQETKSWASTIDPARFNGFNLIIGDWLAQQCLYLSNGRNSKGFSDLAGVESAHSAAQLIADDMLPKQVYGLSNAALDTPWPKTVKLKTALSEALALENADRIQAQLMKALADRWPAADAQLPATGIPLELERALSSVFVSHPEPVPRYGTRTSWVAMLNHQGILSITEHTHAIASQGAQTHQAQMQWL